MPVFCCDLIGRGVLQGMEKQSFTESRPAVQARISQIFVRIKHCRFTPQGAVKCLLSGSICVNISVSPVRKCFAAGSRVRLSRNRSDTTVRILSFLT